MEVEAAAVESLPASIATCFGLDYCNNDVANNYLVVDNVASGHQLDALTHMDEQAACADRSDLLQSGFPEHHHYCSSDCIVHRRGDWDDDLGSCCAPLSLSICGCFIGSFGWGGGGSRERLFLKREKEASPHGSDSRKNFPGKAFHKNPEVGYVDS